MDGDHPKLTRRQFVAGMACLGAAALAAACQAAKPASPVPYPGSPLSDTPGGSTPTLEGSPIPLPAASYASLPRWRGFNLLEKFTLDGDSSYLEWDFDAMAGWGFNFVRLPTDYRIWTPQPGQYLEQPLKEIDQAVAWGQARQVHVNLCLHRAPGYCVNPPAEPLDLWADGSRGNQARQQFADQWRMFAARYRGISPTELSFNLVNEPSNSITPAQYLRAVSSAVTAIRAEDPNRLILADGLSWGNKPVPELAALKIAQSMHCYQPMELTHYKADWVQGSDQWPVPTWPLMTPARFNAYLYGDAKPDLRSPLVLKGSFPKGSQVILHVDTVSDRANLQMRADGQLVFEKLFTPGAGTGEWKESTYKPEWNIYQAVYDRTYTAALPAAAARLQIEISQGDWLTLSEISASPYPGAPGGKLVLNITDTTWGQAQGAFSLDSLGNLIVEKQTVLASKATLWNDLVAPWVELAKSGTGVHIGEWGAYSYTPHPVVLAWMKDCLDNWKQAGFGWALWNFRGGFGILDSSRADVTYEEYQGHKLDRKMLELLREA
jgi:aryl-phospho-beta-D-glucosidase BglC (GH1 family)